MLIFILIVFLIAFAISILGLYKLSSYLYNVAILKQKADRDNTEDKFNTKLSKTSYFLISLAIFFCIISLITPFVLTEIFDEGEYSFKGKGEIGDIFGGLMSPFINLSAVIVTGLAFYMQYKANKLQVKIFDTEIKSTRKQFKKEQKREKKSTEFQQFESQFYEMLRLHKENVNEIEIKTHNLDILKGRLVFYEMKKELEILIAFLKEIRGKALDEDLFVDAYELFFWGYNNEIKISTEPLNEANFEPDPEHIDLMHLKNRESTESTSNADILIEHLDISFLKGHQAYLGHYYRHLFHTVKFVASKDFLDDKQKLNYLRILRAQLSNYEQIMLFYNWLSKYGSAWQDDTNNFLTQYKMIHNLWYSEMSKEDYFITELKKLVKIYKAYKRDDDDKLFEAGDKID